MPNTRFCVWSMSWSTNSASRVVSLSSHDPKFRSNHTVHRRIVSASDDDSGSATSCSLILTIKTIKRGRSKHGVSATRIPRVPPKVCRTQSRLATGAQCQGHSCPNCKDGRVNPSDSVAIWDLSPPFGHGRRNCKDGRMDCRDYGAFQRVQASRRYCKEMTCSESRTEPHTILPMRALCTFCMEFNLPPSCLP
jgi:hypothetical protein